MNTIFRATVVSFDAGSQLATVALSGERAGRLEAVRCAAHLGADQLAAGNQVAVWLPDPGNPVTALVLAAWSGGSPADETIRDAHDRLDSLLGAGQASPDGARVVGLNADQLDGSHASAFEVPARMDNFLGPGSMATQWYNRMAMPNSPNVHDREMTAEPGGSGNGWAWSTAPDTAYGCGENVATYPHWLYVWQTQWASWSSELRCTDTLPRFKLAICYFYPGSTGSLQLRSTKDANNYTEIEVSAACIKAWKCIAGTRAQVGATLALYPMYYMFRLGNAVDSDFLTWEWGLPWGPALTVFGTATYANMRASAITHLDILFNKGASGNEVFYLDAVRFHT
jgi:hypothetical protein